MFGFGDYQNPLGMEMGGAGYPMPQQMPQMPQQQTLGGQLNAAPRQLSPVDARRLEGALNIYNKYRAKGDVNGMNMYRPVIEKLGGQVPE